jgi:hypothetical protein
VRDLHPDGRPLFVTVSGSFKRHLDPIQSAVGEVLEHGGVVLSPADPRIVDSFGDFVFVSSDRRRSIKGVQNRHLESIRHSDFLWLVCPDGYVGQSAAMEVGFAVSAGIPIYSDVAPTDWTLRQYVTPVGSIQAALVIAARGSDSAASLTDENVLIAPAAALAAVRRELDQVERDLVDSRPRMDDPVERSVSRIRATLSVPSKR